MNGVTIIWSMIVSACLTLAVLYSLAWYQMRSRKALLYFGLLAAATAGMALCELAMMQAATPAVYAVAARWFHVPTMLAVLALMGFVRMHFQAGRVWLIWTTGMLRALSLLLNFTTGQTLNFQEVTSLRHIHWLGQTVAIGEGVPNPWMLVGQASLLLLLAFIVDAAITVWRRGERRQAAIAGGSIAFFLLISGLQAVLAMWQVVAAPVAVSFFFAGAMLPMILDLSRNMIQSAKVSEALRETEARVAAAMDVARLGCYEVLNGIRVTSSEPRVREIFGWSDDVETSGRILEFWLEHIHPDDLAVVMEVRRAMEEEPRDQMTLDYRFLHPERGVVHIHHLAHVMERDSAGKAVRTIGVLKDVTEQINVEAEAARQRMQLAHVSRVSTISQLASSLAHELNQPMGAILRNAEAAELLLNDSAPDLDEVRAILADIRADDQRAGKVIDHIRALMRRHETEVRPLALCTLAADVVNLLRHDADIRGVRLEREHCPPLPLVNGDSVQLQQVVLNLLLNAMDAVAARPAGNRLVRVQARQAGDSVQLAVRDNGCGIPPEKLEHIFEPFNTTKPNGLGMGLVISKTILEAHKGTLQAVNNPEGGGTFTIRLPVGGQ